MRLNDSALRQVARSLAVDREGRLLYRAPRESYRERWFRLKGNLLFFCRTTSMGAMLDPDPLGVLVMDQCLIQLEEHGDRPFVFSIQFKGETDRKHFFSGQNQKQCVDWVCALRAGSVLTLQSRMEELRSQIKAIQGKDPVDDMISLPSRTSVIKKVSIKPPTSHLSMSRGRPLSAKNLDFIACATGATPPKPVRSAPPPPVAMAPAQAASAKPPKNPASSIDRMGLTSGRPMPAPSPRPAPDLLQFSPPATPPASAPQASQHQSGLILNPSQLQGWEIFD
jgi:hypothetical protein